MMTTTSQVRIAPDDASPSERPRHVDFLILDDAISRLGAIKSRYAQISELQFLAGFSIEETPEALNASHATIEREWGVRARLAAPRARQRRWRRKP